MPGLDGVGHQVVVAQANALGISCGAAGVQNCGHIGAVHHDIGRLVRRIHDQIVVSHRRLIIELIATQPFIRLHLPGHPPTGQYEFNSRIGDGPGEGGDHNFADRLQLQGLVGQLAEPVQGNQNPSLGLFQFLQHPVDIGVGVREDGHTARGQDAVEGHNEFGHVGQHQHHPIARLDAQTNQGMGSLVNPAQQLGVIQALVVEADGRAPLQPIGRALQEGV